MYSHTRPDMYWIEILHADGRREPASEASTDRELIVKKLDKARGNRPEIEFRLCRGTFILVPNSVQVVRD